MTWTRWVRELSYLYYFRCKPSDLRHHRPPFTQTLIIGAQAPDGLGFPSLTAPGTLYL